VRSRRRVARTGRGRYRLRLEAGERQLLRSLVEQLRDLVRTDTDDPGVGRLFPRAYTDDPEREAEYQRLMRDELLEARLGAIETTLQTLERDDVDEGELSAWMRSLNDLRLVLGVRLGVTEDDEPLDLDPEAPDADTRYLFLALGMLLEEVVEALSDG
jgi:hypothetical protein